MKRSDKRRTYPARKLRRTLLAIVLLPAMGIGQDVGIHRCPQADGTVAFQELPCPEPVLDGDGNSQTGSESSGNDEVPAPGSPTPTSKKRTLCEKMTRDAIDDELRRNDTEEAREAYLGELLELTQQLRACKQLPASRTNGLREQSQPPS